MKTGAVIVAGGMSSRMHDFKPMMKIGSITIVERVINTLKQAGADIVVIVTGFQSELLENHLNSKNVICLYNENYASTEMLDSAKIGLQYLIDKCDQILFTPVDIPLFSINTVKELIKCEKLLAKPVCNSKGGHPLLINRKLIPYILNYSGNGGLKDALCKINIEIKRIEVKDEGILLDADTQKDFRNLLKHYKKSY